MNAGRFTVLLIALLSMRKSAKLSLTQSEKYTEPGYILEYHPARLAIGTEMIAPGVWLGSGGRVLEAQKHVPHTNFDISLLLCFLLFCVLACFVCPSKVPSLCSTHHERHVGAFRSKILQREVAFPKKNVAEARHGAPCCSCRRQTPQSSHKIWLANPLPKQRYF